MMSYFKELLQIFNEAAVEYMIVGAHAVMYYSEPRFTKDHDVWVNPTEDNARKVFLALAQFGVPLSDVKWEDFAIQGTVYQIGVTYERIDLITEVTGLSFPECWRRRADFLHGGIPVHVLDKQDLIANKKAVGRAQDLLDVEKLEQPEEG